MPCYADPMKQPNPYVHMAYGFDAGVQRMKFQKGLAPDETPFGLHHAESLGWRATYSVDTPESGLTRLIRKGIKRILGFDLIHAYRNRKLIQAADIVWTMEEVSYLAVCSLPFFVAGMKRPKIIAQTIWLFDQWSDYSALRRWMLVKLLKRVDILTFHSKNYLEIAQSIVPSVPKQLLSFGISGDTFPMTTRRFNAHTPMRLLSMGQDPTRDWDTLIKAFGGDDRFELRIVCRWVTDAAVAPYPNVHCVRDPSMQGFRDLYLWSDAVIVPMVPNQFSGITVAMEAISMGVPVFASDTGGIPTYFEPDEVVYFRPEDPIAMRESVWEHRTEKLNSFLKRAQAHFMRADYTTLGMAKRYIEISERILKNET
jgi:glycosyltransferase involved in cell wall biosynthesis